MSIPLEVTLDRAGRTPYRLTEKASSIRWTTAAMGGFGSCQFTLPGPPPFWKRELSYLGMVRLVLDTQVIWEGRIEDITFGLLDNSTTVTCIGLQGLLSDVSVRRIWSKRDISFVPRSATLVTPDPAYEIATGAFLETDLTKLGIAFTGNGQTSSSAKANQMLFIAPQGLTLTRLYQSREKAGSANLSALIASSSDSGASYTNHINDITNGVFADDIALVANANLILFSANTVTNFTTATTDYVRFYDIRVMGTSLREDDGLSGIGANGFFGGTILRDLVALVPGLTIGVIEDGSDFTIPSIERSVRDSTLSVVSEVAAYYSREWRVWEDGRFDWKAVNLDEPQWISTLADLDSGSEVTSTVDGLAKTIYILYTDAATGLDNEASASSTDQRNPFVKQGKTRDITVSPGFPMTSVSASKLASRLTTDQGTYPLVQGKLVLPATKVIKRATGSPLPAFMIRAGENIVVADMPKTDLFSQGRDGETLFHIVSTEADLETGSMTLEIEGQTRRSDVLLARLAAATRVLTG